MHFLTFLSPPPPPTATDSSFLPPEDEMGPDFLEKGRKDRDTIKWLECRYLHGILEGTEASAAASKILNLGRNSQGYV